MAKVTALIGYDNKTGQILFSEGCDPDGYSYHQVIIPTSYFTDKDADKMHDSDKKRLEDKNGEGDYNIGEREANHACGVYELFTIVIKTIEIPDNFNDIK